jgi:glutathione peroxidase
MKIGILGVLCAVIGIVTYNNLTGKIVSRPMGMKETATKRIYDYNVNSLDGKAVSMEIFKGKKIVILNVASECGYTPQYAAWQSFYEANKDKFVVLGFPCNDFGGQEPGSAQQIAGFCQKNYGVTFPMFEKVKVKGKDKAPIYQWLTDPALNGWNDQEPGWNFCKYLIDEQGKLTHFFASRIKPDSADFLKAAGL